MTGTCQYCQFETQAGRLDRNSTGLYCKVELRCFNRLLQRERSAQSKLKRVLHVGAQMANICFNWSQSEALHANDRKLLKEMYADWDRVKR